MSPDPRVAHVAAMVSMYDDFVRSFAAVPSMHRYYRPGETMRSSILWRKMEDIVDYCLPREIPPTSFLKAQFEMWEPPSKNGKYRKTRSFPTPRQLGTSGRNVERYEAWVAKRRSLLSANVELVDDSVRRIIDSVRRNRPELSERDFFHDPLLIRTLPVDAARQHPLFREAKAEGAFNNDIAQLVLREYLVDLA